MTHTTAVYEMPVSDRSPINPVAPKPLPPSLPPVPNFDSKLLPTSIRPWCEDVADSLQVPLDFTAIPAMVGLAATLSRSIGVRMKRNQQWIELPILWGCVVGRPSSGKSPALYPTRRLLERLEELDRKSFEVALRDHQADALIAMAKKQKRQASKLNQH